MMHVRQITDVQLNFPEKEHHLSCTAELRGRRDVVFVN